jgi:sterol desaturase/sphingolipid hydroxylase (fatty acid hydroxylase superfamily)
MHLIMDSTSWFDPEWASGLLKIVTAAFATLALALSARAIRRRGRSHELGEFLANLSCGGGMYIISTVTFRWLHSLADGKMTGHGPFQVSNPLLAIVISALAVDFFSYVYHVAAHRTRLLWSFHLVHHSARHFNLSLGPRQSWVERAIAVPVCYVPVAALVCWGLNVSFWYLLIGHQLVFLVAFVNHTTACERWPLGLGWILMNPGEHKVHHGIESRHFDCNYGLALRCWDLCFGTYRAPDVAMSEIAVGVAEFAPTRRVLEVQAQTFKYLADRTRVSAPAGGRWVAASNLAVDVE